MIGLNLFKSILDRSLGSLPNSRIEKKKKKKKNISCLIHYHKSQKQIFEDKNRPTKTKNIYSINLQTQVQYTLVDMFIHQLYNSL